MTSPAAPRWRALLLAALAVLTMSSALIAAPAALAYPGGPWFKAGARYTGDFPDPSVMRLGSTYYAYATNGGGTYLPVMTSTDLHTWTARPAYRPGRAISTDPWFNDALPQVARWAARGGPGKWDTGAWAPSVAPVGSHFVLAYTVMRSLHPFKQCISVATATSPLGPFTDTSTGPIVCSSDPHGSIDPQVFVAPNRVPYLVWKNEGVPGCCPTRIWSRQLAPSGTAFAAHSRPANLLTTAQRWEGNLIEGPSMAVYRGRYYLFYSANQWASAAYATGYALCRGPLGPCARPSTRPLLASGAGINGPGGPSAFVDTTGTLRLAYAAWNAPYHAYPSYPACSASGTCSRAQRFLHVATLAVDAKGLLSVRARG